MKYFYPLLALFVTVTMSGCIVVASSPMPSKADFHRYQELSLDANSLTTLTVDAGAGSLTVLGEQGLTSIKVTADIYTAQQHSNDVELTLERSGSNAEVVAKSHHDFGSWIGHSPHIDVVVHVPATMNVVIHDGSGGIELSDIKGSVRIKDGSGAIVVNRVSSQLSIHDGSGSIGLSNIKGAVDIIDGSGDITVTDIVGDLTINDGSGTINASNISGNAKFNDGSGDLFVKQVSGEVTVSDGSGDINIDHAGSVNIVESGSGGLTVNHVKGQFNSAQ